MTETAYEAISLRLTELHQHLPMLVTQYPGEAFWDAYAGIADPILDAAGAISDQAWIDASDYLRALLYNAGLIDYEELEV